MKYDAFISYRHSDLDTEFAKKVHAGLETYKIPKPVQKKCGKKSIQRVFRDQEELPIGSDLDDNITAAIRESAFLVVICSPRTPESYWVAKEIDAFISYHGRDNILAVLVEGEPSESFPRQLLVDNEGRAVEPLAADVRGESKKERNEKFKTELLRLAAPIIGCTYDDLKQRHRERKMRRMLATVGTIAGVVALAGTAFGVYYASVADKMKRLADDKAELAEEKTQLAYEMEELAREKTQLALAIGQEYNNNLVNQSKVYAATALGLFEKGDRRNAVLVAKEALPDGDNDRPFVPEAEYVLGKALYSYADGSKLDYERTLKHDSIVRDFGRNTIARVAYSIDELGKIYTWSMDDWQLITVIEPELSANNSYIKPTEVNVDANGIYASYEEYFVTYDYMGNVLSKVNYKERCISADICLEENRLFAIGIDNIEVYEISSGREIHAFKNDIDQTFNTYNFEFYAKGNKFGISHFNYVDEHTYVSIYDMNDFSVIHVELDNGYVLGMDITASGNILVLTMEDMYKISNDVLDAKLELIESNTGEILWTNNISQTINNRNYKSIVDSRCFSEDGVSYHNEVMTAIDTKVYTYDEFTGELISSMDVSGRISAIYPSTINGIAYIGQSNGNVSTVNLTSGRVFSELVQNVGMDIEDIALGGGCILIREKLSSSLYVMEYHSANDFEKIMTSDEDGIGVAPSGNYFVTYSDNIRFYDINGNFIIQTEALNGTPEIFIFDEEDRFILGTNAGQILTADINLQRIDSFNINDVIEDELYICDVTFSNNGRYAVVWSLRDVYVIDLATHRVIGRLEAENSIAKTRITDDGNYIFVSEIGKNVYRYNVETGEIKSYDNALLQISIEAKGTNFITISDSGDRFAISCYDNCVRVVNADNGKIEQAIPLVATCRAFIAFVDNDTKLILQGDNYNVSIWDLSNDRMVSLMTDCCGEIAYIDYDEDDRFISIWDGKNIILYDAENNGRLAMAESTFGYIEATNTFIANSMGEFYLTRYKNYNELIEEANRQFPGDNLSDEECIEYNIERN